MPEDIRWITAAEVADNYEPIGGGGSTPFLSSHVARVDPSGDDSTGTVGNLNKPFLTVQGAIDGLEAANPVGNTWSIVDIGAGNPSGGGDLTTSLSLLAIKAITEASNYTFDSITFTGNTGSTRYFRLDNIQGWSVLFPDETGTCTVELEDSYVGDVTADASTGLSCILSFFNGAFQGTISNPGHPILILSGYSNLSHPNIDSEGSAVTAYSSQVANVAACASIDLYDSRIIGTNSSSVTPTYHDKLLNHLGDVGQLALRADPPGSPAEGMIYADTDHHLYYYNGTDWKQLDNTL